jgi:hypothetical protein
MVENNETGYLFKNEDSNDLANKIIDFYQQYINKDYTTSIFNYNKSYSWIEFSKQLVEKII